MQLKKLSFFLYYKYLLVHVMCTYYICLKHYWLFMKMRDSSIRISMIKRKNGLVFFCLHFTVKKLNLLNCVPYVLTCQCGLHALRANVPTCLVCLRAHVLQLQIIKISFQWQVLLRFLVHFLSFSCEVKVYMKSARQAGMSLKTFTLRI